MESLWQYSTVHNSACFCLEEQALWGQTTCRIWLPNQGAVVSVPCSDLRPLHTQVKPEIEAWRIAYVAAAAKVAGVMEGLADISGSPVLLAPMESKVIALPHQIHALSRAISGEGIRYLLADEVGLGKTIEAGLILRELKLRGFVRRTLVVVPKGLATQWVAEMQTHFNEHFQLVMGDDISTLQRLLPVKGSDLRIPGSGFSTQNQKPVISHRLKNPWSMFDQVIVSLDSVKPMDKRRGWTAERIAEHNRSRFEDLITAGWDLVVVDEAHKLGGSTNQIARYKLGKGLAEAAPYVLLLSATPHQGRTDAFHRLMSLLDGEAFPDIESISRKRVDPYVIRTEKRKAIDSDGKPLFKPRLTQMIPIAWESHHNLQKLLYEAVTDYVREGYNQALQDKKRHIGFLMLLMQRLVVSSTRAIKTTLERRLSVLSSALQVQSSKIDELDNDNSDLEALNPELIYDMDGQELLDELLKFHFSALKSEGSLVETLLNAAMRCERKGPDAKAEKLLEKIYALQAEENEPDLKVLIFTEFIPTQQMLRDFLEARGISVVTLNGSMSMDERRQAQDAFHKSHRVMVSTDAGGEGLNLQFAHIVINYDIPWNPMRLEQRIGRVDRIGQIKAVRALNFVFEESVEFRVREVLEQKLSIIFHEFGIDKTGDVLDSAQAGALFEDVFASAILNPDDIETTVDQTMSRIRSQIRQVRESSAIFGISETLDIQAAQLMRSHPLPHWVEQMTIGYINSHGGAATKKRSWWDLTWPDGQEQRKCVFSSQDADRLTDATLLNLEDIAVRELAMNLPQMAVGQAVPCLYISELPSGVAGFWGLFEIRLQAGMNQKTQFIRIPMTRRGFIGVFLSEDGKLFLPTARYVWDALQTTELKVQATLDPEESLVAHQQLQEAAKQAGEQVFDTLKQTHFSCITREEERGSVYFASQRKAINQVGLPEVRRYRLARCNAQEAQWQNEVQFARQIVPEIRTLLVLHIIQGGA